MTCANGYGLLMAGRVFVGLGVGFGLAIDPLYIAEVSPAAHRGELVTWSGTLHIHSHLISTANISLELAVVLTSRFKNWF
jgi:MFS family permease